MSKRKSGVEVATYRCETAFDLLITQRLNSDKYTNDKDEQGGAQTKVELLTAVLEFIDTVPSASLPINFTPILEDTKFITDFYSRENVTFSPSPWHISEGQDFTDTAAFTLRALLLSYRYLAQIGQLKVVGEESIRAIITKAVTALIRLVNRTGAKGPSGFACWGAVKDDPGGIYFSWSAITSLASAHRSNFFSRKESEEFLLILKNSANWLVKQFDEKYGFKQREDDDRYHPVSNAYAILAALNIFQSGFYLEALDNACQKAFELLLNEVMTTKSEKWRESQVWYIEKSQQVNERGTSFKGEQYDDFSSTYVCIDALCRWIYIRPGLNYSDENKNFLLKLSQKYLQPKLTTEKATHIVQRALSAISAYYSFQILKPLSIDGLKLLAACRELIVPQKLADELATSLFDILKEK